jgi:hypothetical protein
LFDILGVVALEEGRSVELAVQALFIHRLPGGTFDPPVLW